VRGENERAWLNSRNTGTSSEEGGEMGREGCMIRGIKGGKIDGNMYWSTS
jgi:hypothetical protein